MIKKTTNTLKYFSLTSVKSIKQVSEGLSGDKYLVKTKESEFFLTFTQRRPEEVLNDVSIQKQVQDMGYQSPRYLSFPDKKCYYQINDEIAVISKKIPGYIPSRVTKSLAFNIGRALAKFHLNVKQLPYPQSGWMSFDVQEVRVNDSRLKTANLPRGITHGDFHYRNLHVLREDESKIFAIFDFEEVGEDILLLDLARSIIGVCNTADGNKLTPELIAAQVQGYQFVRPLLSVEKQLLSSAVDYTARVCIDWFYRHGCERYVPSHEGRLASFVSPFE